MRHVTGAVLRSDWLRANHRLQVAAHLRDGRARADSGSWGPLVSTAGKTLRRRFFQEFGTDTSEPVRKQVEQKNSFLRGVFAPSLEPTNCNANVHKATMNNAAAVSQRFYPPVTTAAITLQPKQITPACLGCKS